MIPYLCLILSVCMCAPASLSRSESVRTYLRVLSSNTQSPLCEAATRSVEGGEGGEREREERICRALLFVTREEEKCRITKTDILVEKGSFLPYLPSSSSRIFSFFFRDSIFLPFCFFSFLFLFSLHEN